MSNYQYIVTGDDESYTYPSLILPILKYIPKNKIIWCPFDINEDKNYDGIKLYRSNYVAILEAHGYTVVSSHIVEGKDFFEYEPDKWDIIVSNPPFKNKRLFFERALSFNKPFILLNTASWLNDGGLHTLFSDKQMQLLMPKTRSKFFNSDLNPIGKQPSFKAIYYCYDILPRDIVWFELDKQHDEYPLYDDL